MCSAMEGMFFIRSLKKGQVGRLAQFIGTASSSLEPDPHVLLWQRGAFPTRERRSLVFASRQ